MSQWSEIANVLYIPALFVLYGGRVVRFFQHWRAVMKWPDILLLCFGLVIMGAVTVPKIAPYFEQSPSPVPVMAVQASHAIPTAIGSAELDALRQTNAKLKAEKARLRKLRVAAIVRASPSPAPSASPSFPSVSSSGTVTIINHSLTNQDCQELLTAQQLYDGAVDGVTAATPNKSNGEDGKQKYNDAAYMQDQAAYNLNQLVYRLCH